MKTLQKLSKPQALLYISTACLSLSSSLLLAQYTDVPESVYSELPTQRNARFYESSVQSQPSLPSGYNSTQSQPSYTSPASQSSPAVISDAVRPLEGHLVDKYGSAYRFPSQGQNLDYIIYYFSASYCPHCQAFTPKLIPQYTSLKSRYPNFEIVLVDFDRSSSSMFSYMEQHNMPWPAVIYDQRGSIPIVTEYSGTPIPCLIVVDRNGNVITTNARDNSRDAQDIWNEFTRLVPSR